MVQLNDLRDAGQLIQFGLRPNARPATKQEYQDLVDRYEDNAEFRTIVREIAAGLGLQVLQASRWGLVLAPTSDSVFGMSWSDYRNFKQLSADDRLLDGLIHIAIMATVFPRAQDLDDDPALVRPPITVDDVETMLRGLCASMEEESRGKPDPASNELGLYEAWRVYQKRSSDAKTKSGRKSSKATRKLIEKGLEFLRKHGCFVYRKTGDREAYQATWRYQVMVQEFSVEPIYAVVRDILTRRSILEGNQCQD
jgi:hypothetical protein